MSDDFQRIVDDLALRLGRPVLLEDHAQRVIAYSAQTGPVDEVRRDSILRRHTTPQVRQWVRSAGIFDSPAAVRVAAAPALGLLPRVCVPARHDGRLLGFLWLIDAEPSMPDEDVAIAAAAAPGLALTLFHDNLVTGLAARRELEAVTAVLLGDRDAARLLTDAGNFPADQPVTVLVARPVPGPAGTVETGEAVGMALERGLLALRFRLRSRHMLHLVRSDHGVLLIAGPPVDPHDPISVPVVVGIGRPRPTLADAAGSYREALHAAEVAARIPGFGLTAEWSQLGVYRMLDGFSGELHPGLARLLTDPQHLPLLHTLETYLDLAGSASATSRALRLHRTSLYYRLQRVAELAGADLKDGNDRLALHLSLKLARLSGRYLPRSGAGSTPALTRPAR